MEVVKNLEKFMMTNSNISNWSESIIELKEPVSNVINKSFNKENKIISEIPESRKKINYFVSDQQDKLFWIFFVICNSINMYNQNKLHLYELEQKFKYDSIKILKSKKDILKSLKFKIQDTESSLITDKLISLKVIAALCVCYEKSIFIKKEDIYYDFNYGEDYNFIEYKNNKYILYLGDQSKTIEEVKNNQFGINIQKPIKSVSSYKLKELQEIAEKLNIEVKKCDSNSLKMIYLKKNELYELLLNKIKKLT